MIYEAPLIEAHFLKRYKRFFADIEIDGKKAIAHVPNTGSLKTACEAAAPCRVSPAQNPERKLKWTLEQVKTANSWVGVNTQKANTLAREAIESFKLNHWQNHKNLKAEVKINPETRLDFSYEKDDKIHFIEVKNVTMQSNGVALFPDAETTRGQKHLRELTQIVRESGSAEILFIIQRTDVECFMPAEQIDPEYTKLLISAQKAGVILSALMIQPKTNGLIIDKPVKIQLNI